MKQRWLLSRGTQAKIARQTWIDSTLEETIVKVLMDGLTACRIPIFRVRERISKCPKCYGFVGQPSQAGVPDLVGWIPSTILDAEVMSRTTYSLPLFIECKRPIGGIESAVQKEFIDRARRGGAVAFFCRGWDECVAELRGFGVQLPEGI